MPRGGNRKKPSEAARYTDTVTYGMPDCIGYPVPHGVQHIVSYDIRNSVSYGVPNITPIGDDTHHIAHLVRISCGMPCRNPCQYVDIIQHVTYRAAWRITRNTDQSLIHAVSYSMPHGIRIL